jgi:hypothetical protein
MTYQIIKPCGENWNKMKPVDSGRFCNKCSKKVHDLTKEVLVLTEEESCGRMLMPKTIHINYSKRSLLKNPLRYFLVLFVLLFNRYAKAQDFTMLSTEENFPPGVNDSVSQTIYISGQIRDKKTKETIPFASVVVYNTKKEQIGFANTDFNGIYKIELNTKKINGKSITLRVVYVGYQPTEVTKIFVDIQKKLIIDVNMSSGSLELYEVGLHIACPPLIDPFGSGTTITRDEFIHHPKG